MSESALWSLPTDYRWQLRLSEQGRVLSVGDGIIWIEGLPSAMLDEVLHLADGSIAMVFLLDTHRLGAIVLVQQPGLAAGVTVWRSHQRLSINVGDALLGRIINALGQPLDDGPALSAEHRAPLERPSPPIMARDFVSEPLYTGNRVIDTLIPIGKGQRQLIIGDDGVGKTSLALDTILRQRDEQVICVYVSIAQTRSQVATVIDLLRREGALDYTTVVVAEANELSGSQYLAPFAGCTLAEYWMRQGKDVLIIYDDLSQHAQAYRELSLLLHRPPGREAYPGDIFYLHSRLLERSTVLSQHEGGGSMTALPIVQTRQGEISSYIPTNLISITDGQIYLDQRLFAAGTLPAIDITRSVSRIGGKAQHPAIKTAAGHLRLDFLQFLELEAFTRFGTRLDAPMTNQLQRGRLLRAVFNQERLHPISAKAQLLWLIAYQERRFDTLTPAQLTEQLPVLEQLADRSALSLTSARAEWLALLQQWRPQQEPLPT